MNMWEKFSCYAEINIICMYIYERHAWSFYNVALSYLRTVFCSLLIDNYYACSLYNLTRSYLRILFRCLLIILILFCRRHINEGAR